MRLRHFYLLLAIAGIVLTYSQLIPFMIANGMDMVLLFSELFKNHATSFFAYDLLVTALACLIFLIVDGRRLKLPKLWIPIAGVFAVGVAFGFPLYLYMRDLHMEKAKDKA